MKITEYVEKAREFGFEKQVGYIYVIQNDSGYCKIGTSINPEGRIGNIKRLGGILEGEHFISEPIIAHIKVENRIHGKLSSFRQDGEWFNRPLGDCVKAVNEIIQSSHDLYAERFRVMDERHANRDKDSKAFREFLDRMVGLPKVEEMERQRKKETQNINPLHLWENWIGSDEMPPSKYFMDILAYSISMGGSFLLTWSFADNAWMCPETHAECSYDIDFWMPVTSPPQLRLKEPSFAEQEALHKDLMSLKKL